MIWRFFFSFAFQAAGGGGESLRCGSVESEDWLRGERRSEGDSAGLGNCGDPGGGEERAVRSRESISCALGAVGWGGGDVKSRLSTTVLGMAFFAGSCVSAAARSNEGALGTWVCALVRSRLSTLGMGCVLLRRGEVRRVRVDVARVVRLSLEEDLEDDIDRDELDDVELSTAGIGWVVCTGRGGINGDERVKSREPVGSEERRNCAGEGIGASSKILARALNLVGV